MSNELLTFLLDHEDFRKARLPSLYSDFTTLRTSNPDGFAANFTAWKNVLSAASLNGITGSDRLALDVDQGLMRDLATAEWGMPGALPTVVSEAVGRKEFIPKKSFLESTQSIYHTRLLDPWNVVSWGVQKAGLNDMWILQQLGIVRGTTADKIATEKYVVVANVEKVANSVLKHMSKRARKVDKLFTLDAFGAEVDGMVTAAGGTKAKLSDDDVKVLLKFLTRDVHEASIDKENAVVKFKDPNEVNPTAVSEEDATIARLKSLITRLNSEVEELSSKMESHQQKAKVAVGARNEKLARHALVMKALAKGAMETKLDRLSQLEGVFQKLEQAGDNAEMVRTLEDSSRVLEKMNKEVGGVEKVEKLLDELHDHMYKTEEISNLLGEPGDMTVDPQDVEDEFELMREQEEAEQRKEQEDKKKAREQEEADKLAEILGSVSLTADPSEVKPNEAGEKTAAEGKSTEEGGSSQKEEEPSESKIKEEAMLAT